ncbi:MAG: amidohydrolase family protein, partial [Actinomycetales bacterium]
QMAGAGIPILAGTDAGVPGVEHGVIADAITALVAEVGLPLEAALRSGTSTAARAFGLGGVTGSVKAGLDADLVLLDGDLRVDVDALRRPRQVWRAGSLVASDGRLINASGD